MAQGSSSSSSSGDESLDDMDTYALTYGQTRLERGFRIATDQFELLRVGQIRRADAGPVHNSIQRTGRGLWRVRSQHSNTHYYDVCRVARGVWTCTCPDVANSCKHIISCMLSRRPRGAAQTPLQQHVATFPPTTSRAYFPYGSTVLDPATAGHGCIDEEPTGYAQTEWDAQFVSVRERVSDLLPAENGVALQQPYAPSEAWFVATVPP